MDAEHEEAPPRDEPAPREVPLQDAIARTLGGLDLDGPSAGALALDAAWLALSALGERVRGDLERIEAASRASSAARSKRSSKSGVRSTKASSGDGGVPPARAARLELALALRRYAADASTGVAERAVSALACVALACADPALGRPIQRALGGLRLLGTIEQIPLARRVRKLLLELRHLPFDGRAVPVAFVARVDDLLERLDAERLLAVSLHGRAAALSIDDEARLALALGDAPPRLHALARLLVAHGEPLASAHALVTLARSDPASPWSRLEPAAARRAVVADHAALRPLLASSAWPLAGGRGRFGVARGGDDDAGRPDPHGT